ncbi:MAG: adenylate/guanylate cyclase domain-containing protein, partial [Acidimicrobiia bacterium]|nr:adenylate/guanylate cyclase domain-containing protein [Acidimicrobiia bacterium]
MAPAAETETRTILFTDIVESTRMRTALGDVAADAVRRDHDAILREAIERHQGTVGKWLGDGVMAVFESAAAAVECAAEMQRQVTDHSSRAGLDLAIRIGLSAGDVAEEDGDWYGTPVVEAARLEASADAGQIVVAEIVRQLAGTRTSLAFGPTRELSLKGLGAPLPACAVSWGGDADPEVDLRAVRHLRLVPASAPELVGRAGDLAELSHLLGEPSALVTLTGPGGVGKTRLACAAAEDAAATGGFPSGVHFVDLASVGPEQVVNAVASVLDVREAPTLDLQASVAAHIAGRRMLLILDNCEHVVNAVAQLAHTLLADAPEVVMVATSQVPLGIAEEVVYGVAPLGLPPETTADADRAIGSPAVQLFVDRARRSNRGFALTDETASSVVQICRRLDGIPLAIELAAARSRALSPSQIAERLDDRFHLLTGGSRTAVERHQTLRAAVDWSYSLLSADERRLLARVSSFPGGFDLEAAEQIGSDDAPDGVSR